MKNTLKICSIAFTIFSLACTFSVHAQSIYKIRHSQDIDMKLSGTSTLHKWTMEAQTFTGIAQFIFKKGSTTKLIDIKSLTFELAVKDLKSDEKALDKNAYKALKTDDYKDIVYSLTSAIVTPAKNNNYLIKTQGDLSIAGVTKSIAMDVSCLVNKDESITCKGSDKLKMTDYQVKPPTFLLGAMKTGDDITLDFILVYSK